MKKTALLIMIGMTFVLMNGCATITGKEVEKEHQVNTEQDTKTFKFSKEGFSQSISSNQINTDNEEEEFFRHLLALDLVEKSNLYELREFFTTQGNVVKQGVEADIMEDFRGDGNEGNISLKHTSYGDDYVDATYSIFEVDYKESDQFYHLSAKCPSVVQEYASARGPNPERPFTIKEIKTDVTSVCSNMDPLLELKRVVKGEVNSDFKPEPVRNNFARILNDDLNYQKIARDNRQAVRGLMKSGIDTKKASYYEITGDGIDGKTMALVAIYPYRSGSKINYAFLHDYSLTSDGNVESAEEQIGAVKDRITEIVND